MPNKCHLLWGHIKTEKSVQTMWQALFWMASASHLPFCLLFFLFVLHKGKICLVTSLLPTSNLGIHEKEATATGGYRFFYSLCPWSPCVDLWLQAMEHQAVHLFKDVACVAATQSSSEFSRDESENKRDRFDTFNLLQTSISSKWAWKWECICLQGGTVKSQLFLT